MQQKQTIITGPSS